MLNLLFGSEVNPGAHRDTLKGSGDAPSVKVYPL